MKRGRYIC